jgi:hypothetical protein
MAKANSTPVTAIGSGYNTFLGSAMQTIVDVKTDAGQGSTDANVYVCKTTQQMYNALEINASVAVSSPWGSFADRLRLINTLNTNTTTVTIIVSATVVNNSWTVSDATFKSTYATAGAVYKQGGDSYVSYVAKGGQFIAAYSFVAYDEQTYQELSNVADVNFPGWGAEFDAHFEVNLKNISQTTGISYHNEMHGIGFSSAYPDPENLVHYVLNFGTVTFDAPAVLDFATRSYKLVPACPDFTLIHQYSTAYIDPTSTGLGYADIELLAKTNLAIVTNVTGIYDNYGFLSIDLLLSTVPPNLNHIIASIAVWRQTVDIDPTNPNIDPPIIDDQYLTVPTPRYSLVPSSAVGSFSAGDGYALQDITAGMIERCVLPSSVQVCGGDVINKLVTTYTQNDEDMPTFTITRGGNDGSNFPPWQLGPGELITQITTCWDDHVCRMSIGTGSQSGVFYPCNTNGPHVTTWSTPTDGNMAFVGWQGKSNWALDGLQAIYVQFRPPHWKRSSMEKPPQRSKALRKALMRMSQQQNKSLDFVLQENSLGFDNLLDFNGRFMPTEDDVLKIVINWATLKSLLIGEAYAQSGGWEGWAQVELAIAFKRAFPDTTIQREVHSFDVSSYKADFMLTYPGYRPLIIEIKCESSGQDIPGPSAFWRDYATDLQKATNYLINPTYLPADVWTIGFTCNDDVSNKGQELLKEGKFRPYNVGDWPCGQTATGDMVNVWGSVDYISKSSRSKL